MFFEGGARRQFAFQRGRSPFGPRPHAHGGGHGGEQGGGGGAGLGLLHLLPIFLLLVFSFLQSPGAEDSPFR